MNIFCNETSPGGPELVQSLQSFERGLLSSGLRSVRWSSDETSKDLQPVEEPERWVRAVLHVQPCLAGGVSWLLFIFLQRVTSCSEDQSEGDAVPTRWHHHPPEETGTARSKPAAATTQEDSKMISPSQKILNVWCSKTKTCIRVRARARTSGSRTSIDKDEKCPADFGGVWL